MTNTSLAYCLHQVAEMPNISILVSCAVRSAAYLAEQIEDLSVNEMVREAVVSQLNELAKDVKCLVEDVKDKFDGYVEARLEQQQSLKQPPAVSHPTVDHVGPARNYAEALATPSVNANPRIAAREGIRARQLLLEGVDPASKVG